MAPLQRFRRPGRAPTVAPLQPRKLWAIGEVVRRTGARSLVDCGGVWAVEGGYTMHAADEHDLDRVVLVDTGTTDVVREEAERRGSVELVDGNFGDPAVIDRVGDVDVVLFFDVLLHQVAPDWDAVLRAWAARANAVAVVQPNWADPDAVVRLVELGEDRYRAAVPDEPNARALFDRLDEIHPRYGRPWRDVHEVWQWGLGARALDRVAEGAGLHRVAFVDDGPWRGLADFRYQTCLYTRATDTAGL